MFDTIMQKIEKGVVLTKQDAVELLNVKNASDDFYKLLSKSNGLSRERYGNKGYIFAQIGLNAKPCSGNCKFCSLAQDHFHVDAEFEKDAEQVVAEARAVSGENIEALFLMTTADYDKEKFIGIGKAVREIVPQSVQLVANIGDFDHDFARRLKSAGFTGAYHIVRLKEGIDTDIEKETRISTIEAIKAAGLELYYCVEPIGREHTYDEIADEMIRAQKYEVNVMAVMARVGVNETQYDEKEAITELELTKIAAVTRLVTNPQKSMNVHEAKKMPLLAGVNQLYAEYGANPRDVSSKTETNRGFNVADVRKMLLDAEYTI